MRVVDEIATDFIQGLSFQAAQAAHHAGRQKVKYEDFEFALRSNPLFLGKVREIFELKKEVSEARRWQDIGGEGGGIGGLAQMGRAELEAFERMAGGQGAAGGGPGGEDVPGSRAGGAKGRRKKSEAQVGEEDLLMDDGQDDLAPEGSAAGKP